MFWSYCCCQPDDGGSPSSPIVASALPLKEATVQDHFDEEFEVPIHKVSFGPVGLDIGLRDNDFAVVRSIHPGAVADWNAEVDECFRILEGDRIVQVNSVRGPSAVLVGELQNVKFSTYLTLRVRRRREVRLKLKLGHGKIGLDLNCNKSRESLIVRSVTEGVIKTWNATSKSNALRVGDRIIEVNGVRGRPTALLEALRASSEYLDIVFVRFS